NQERKILISVEAPHTYEIRLVEIDDWFFARLGLTRRDIDRIGDNDYLLLRNGERELKILPYSVRYSDDFFRSRIERPNKKLREAASQIARKVIRGAASFTDNAAIPPNE